MVELGETCGVIAAQSIGEPGTQLTMRTFHVGGTASRVQDKSRLDAKNNGFVRFINLNTVEAKDGLLVAMNRSGSVVIQDERGREKERYQVVYGARLKVKDGEHVKLGQLLAEWDPYTYSILTEIGGTVQFKDLQEGITLNEEVDEVTGLSRWVVADSPDEKRQPAFVVKNAKANKRYLLPRGAHLMIQDGEDVGPGDVLAKIPKESTRTKDITGGLPRVVELFEARKPRETAIISEIDGVVRFGEVSKGQRKIYVTADNGDEKEYSVQRGIHVNVQEGERLRAGDPLMDGPLNPHDILDVLGEKELQSYLVNEIQEVYRLQGVAISDKHIEVIVRQMLRWVRIDDVGDTNFLLEQQVDRFRFREENDRVMALGGRPSTGRPLLLGITKASLSTDSFISAASFQETTRVLTEAAINGKVDYLRGLKENVIMGRLVPAGTGMEFYRKTRIAGEDIVEEPTPEPTLDALAGYEDEARLQYTGGLSEDLGPEETLAE
jgi:DNA-directed RNA polymerase subunit beta'